MYGNNIFLKQLFKWKNLWVCGIQSAILNHGLPDRPEEALLEIFVSPAKRPLLARSIVETVGKFEGSSTTFRPPCLWSLPGWASSFPRRLSLAGWRFSSLSSSSSSTSSITSPPSYPTRREWPRSHRGCSVIMEMEIINSTGILTSACIFFLFGSLMSYALILYMLLRQKLEKQTLKKEGLHMIYSKDCKVHPPPEIKQRLEDLDEIDRCQRMSSIDALFLRLFPLSFLVFNLIYWPYWVMMPDESAK